MRSETPSVWKTDKSGGFFAVALTALHKLIGRAPAEPSIHDRAPSLQEHATRSAIDNLLRQASRGVVADGAVLEVHNSLNKEITARMAEISLRRDRAIALGEQLRAIVGDQEEPARSFSDVTYVSLKENQHG